MTKYSFSISPLSPNDIKVPNSITFHLADIYLDELEKAVIWQEGSQAEGGEEAGSSDEEESQVSLPRPALASWPFSDVLRLICVATLRLSWRLLQSQSWSF